MGIAKLYGQSGSGGFKPNGIIQDYYVYAGERIEKGDFVELLTSSNGDEKETQVRKASTSDIYGVAKSSGGGGDIIKVYQPYPEKRLVMADGNILTTSNGDVFLLKEAI